MKCNDDDLDCLMIDEGSIGEAVFLETDADRSQRFSFWFFRIHNDVSGFNLRNKFGEKEDRFRRHFFWRILDFGWYFCPFSSFSLTHAST